MPFEKFFDYSVSWREFAEPGRGKPFRQFLAVLLMLAWFHGAHCEENKPVETPSAAVRLGVWPDTTPERVIGRYKPLARHLEKSLHRPIEIVLSRDYDDLLTLFGNKKIDMALFGGMVFVKAQALYRAEPLVLRDLDLKFTSLFLVRKNDRRQRLTDFKGARFSFGDRISTSGHYMPRYFLHEQGIIPENFFGSVVFSGAHDKTAFAVRDGQADIGSASAPVVRAMLKEGRLSENDLRVLWETPYYTDYVYAVQPDMAPNLKTALLDAFLSLTPSNPEQRAILSALSAQSFIPANRNDFAVLQSIYDSLDRDERHDRARN